MKSFKKRIATIIVISLILNLMPMTGSIRSLIFPGNITPGIVAKAEETISFSDVPSYAWYYEDLQYILRDERKIFAGYPDGTFRPNETLTVDMFIKLIITIMGHKIENGIDYWAATYIEKAIDEGLIIPWQDSHLTFRTKEDPYAGYKNPISRGDMALIAGRALDRIIDNPEYRDQIAVSSLIKDYSSMPPSIRANVVRFYDLGILTGYPDGEFKPDNYLTRAEAVAVIRRIIDPSARIRAELPVSENPSPTPIPVSELNRPPKKDLGNGVVEVEGIRFDPEKDTVNTSSKAMRILKAEEFVGVFLKHLKFYEHKGKVRVCGYIPELPNGYKWEMAIIYWTKEPADDGSWGSIFSTNEQLAPEQSLPEPGKTFDRSLRTGKDNIDSLYLTFEILTPNNASGGSFYISLTLNEYSRYDAAGGHSLDTYFDSRGFFEW
ncbi:MAG TPA: S-layer homology domain-containing protein [Thermoclostridium sp.]